MGHHCTLIKIYTFVLLLLHSLFGIVYAHSSPKLVASDYCRHLLAAQPVTVVTAYHLPLRLVTAEARSRFQGLLLTIEIVRLEQRNELGRMVEVQREVRFVITHPGGGTTTIDAKVFRESELLPQIGIHSLVMRRFRLAGAMYEGFALSAHRDFLNTNDGWLVKVELHDDPLREQPPRILHYMGVTNGHTRQVTTEVMLDGTVSERQFTTI